MKSVTFSLAMAWLIMVQAIACFASPRPEEAGPQRVTIEDFVAHAIEANKALETSRLRWLARSSTVSSAKSLPDPMVMIGYKNDGFDTITYGNMEGSELMTSVSQTFPFWGKRELRRDTAKAEADALGFAYQALRLDTERRARELYLDLFFTYRAENIYTTRMDLLNSIERAALNRYTKGMSSQSEIIMVQSEKYMIVEKIEMLLQKRRALEAASAAMLDLEPTSLTWQPVDPEKSPAPQSLEHYLALAESSPMVQEKKRMIRSGLSMEGLAQKEFYPDVTFTAQVNSRPDPFTDMWQVSMSFNLPVFNRTKQRAELSAAQIRRGAFESDLSETIRAIQSEVREAHAMALTSWRLMELYEGGFISKAGQSFESTLTAYSNGKVEGMALMRSLAVLTDYEISYWERFVEREKALARIKTITTSAENIAAEKAEKNE